MTQAVWTTFVKHNGVVRTVLRFRTRASARDAAKEYTETVVTRTNSRTAKRLTAAHHRYLTAKEEMRQMAEARTRKGRRAMKAQKPVTLTFAFM